MVVDFLDINNEMVMIEMIKIDNQISLSEKASDSNKKCATKRVFDVV